MSSTAVSDLIEPLLFVTLNIDKPDDTVYTRLNTLLLRTLLQILFTDYGYSVCVFRRQRRDPIRIHINLSGTKAGLTLATAKQAVQFSLLYTRFPPYIFTHYRIVSLSRLATLCRFSSAVSVLGLGRFQTLNYKPVCVASRCRVCPPLWRVLVMG